MKDPPARKSKPAKLKIVDQKCEGKTMLRSLFDCSIFSRTICDDFHLLYSIVFQWIFVSLGVLPLNFQPAAQCRHCKANTDSLWHLREDLRTEDFTRYLTLAMIASHNSLLRHSVFACERAGDWIEAIGGIIHPWTGGIRQVRELMDKECNSSVDELNCVRRDLSMITRECKRLAYHVGGQAESDDARITHVLKALYPNFAESQTASMQ